MNLRRHSATIRLSTGVAALTVSILLAAQALGLIPDAVGAKLRGRGQLCEAMAIHCSLAAQHGELGTIRAATKEIVARDSDILSAAVRKPDGTLVVEAGDHATHWKAPPGDDVSTPTFVRVPIFNGDVRWGTVEIAFRDLDSGSLLGSVLANPLFRLAVFFAGAGFLAYLIYLRRSLQYLDPAAVIPDRVKAMLDTLAEGVLVLDNQRRIVLANQAFINTVGPGTGDLTGMPASRFGWTHPQADDNTGEETFPWDDALRDGATRTGVALCLKRGEDDLRTFTVNCGPIMGGDGAPRGALATFDDVTPIEKKNAQLRNTLEMLKQSRDEINRQNQELQALATTDPLTGCLNRRSFFAQFEAHWASARRYNFKLSCVMVDVDRFKRINDQHGHSVGDKVLAHVASVLLSLAREGDVVCRYGGEEFCVLLTHTDADGAEQAAERYRLAIERQPCGGISATASLGVAALDAASTARSPQGMIDQADKALYAAKQAGRNRVMRWDRMPPEQQKSRPSEESAANAAAEAAAGAGAGPAGEASSAAAPSGPSIPFGAVTALMSALRYRDAATADHSHRVADYCVATAKDLMTVGECFVLEVAALLHDIGKLGVPDAILLKPGPLDDQEWKTMRAHDRMGAEIVAAAFGSDELTGIVRTHHAWFGGSPRDPGLPTGKEIPLAARTLSIADAYDAMTTDRVYRKGRAREEAFAELRRCAGGQFDPEMVERFIQVVMSADAARTKNSSDTELALARVQQQIERLGHALDARDLTLLRAMAGRLVATAGRDGLGDVAKAAAELERSASSSPDVLDVVNKVNGLMELCKSATSPGAARPAPKEKVVTV
jgi:diguanylate cyclase (GGDEF)-like protein